MEPRSDFLVLPALKRMVFVEQSLAPTFLLLVVVQTSKGGQRLNVAPPSSTNSKTRDRKAKKQRQPCWKPCLFRHGGLADQFHACHSLPNIFSAFSHVFGSYPTQWLIKSLLKSQNLTFFGLFPVKSSWPQLSKAKIQDLPSGHCLQLAGLPWYIVLKVWKPFEPLGWLGFDVGVSQKCKQHHFLPSENLEPS